MSEERDNLVLSLLRAIRADIAEIKTDIAELRHRVGLLEVAYSTMQHRLDRMAGDMERVKRRLELSEAEAHQQ